MTFITKKENMALPFLKTLGLTEKEATLYELLLRVGESPVGVIIKESKFKLATVYKALYAMEKRGFVVKKDIQKIIHFSPVPPARLFEAIEAKFSVLERTRNEFQTMLPILTSSYVASVERPIVTVYDGEDGIKKANLAVLAERKEILAYLVINKEIDKRLEKFWRKYYAIRKKENIHVRSITSDSKEGKEYKKRDAEQLRETKLVPADKFPLTIEKNIVGNKVAFFSTQEGKLIATIVENTAIADTERAIFELAWKQAEYFDKELSS